MAVMQALTAIVFLLALSSVSATERPIIGVLAQETFEEDKHLGDMYIPANYVKYLENAGSRVVPVKIGQTDQYYLHLLKSINGVLFTGGSVNLSTSEVYTRGKFIYDWALKANDAGDYFPLWGTCQGFELLASITGGLNVLSTYDAEDINLPLNFTSAAPSSRLLGHLPSDVYNYLQNENVTSNFHHLGLSPKMYRANNKLNRFYTVLSTNVDKKGKEFISTMESDKYPVYAVQWHPEKNNYAWSVNLDVNHDPDAIRVSQYFADFLVKESRKSTHAFTDMQEEIDAMIYNYNPVYSKSDSFSQNYFFRIKEDERDRRVHPRFRVIKSQRGNKMVNPNFRFKENGENRQVNPRFRVV